MNSVLNEHHAARKFTNMSIHYLKSYGNVLKAPWGVINLSGEKP